MNCEREMSTDKLKRLETTVLGAALGFLPYLMFAILTRQGPKFSYGIACLLWLLTTWVIISEWWSATDIYDRFRSDSLLILIPCFFSMVALLSLPVVLLLANEGRISLASYVVVFVFLSLLDMPISWKIKHDSARKAETAEEEKDRKKFNGERKEFKGYLMFDIVLFALYFIWSYFILESEMAIETKILILYFFYGLEFFFEHKFVPDLTAG